MVNEAKRYGADGVIPCGLPGGFFVYEAEGEEKILFADQNVIELFDCTTFDEFFEILTLKQLDRHRKPIVIYNVNGYYDSLLSTLERAVSEGFMSEKYNKLFFASDNKDEIFDYLDNYEPFSYDKYDIN